MDNNVKNEEDFINEIKDNIYETTLKASEKIVKSAYVHLSKKQCFDVTKDELVKDFFVSKIPAVIAKEVSKELNTILGLDLDIEP